MKNPYYDNGSKAIISVAAFGLVLYLAILGFIAWVVLKLMSHFGVI